MELSDLTIQELEEQLKRKKAEPQVKNLLRTKEQLMQYIGKCYATHALSKDYMFVNNKRKTTRTRTVSLYKITDVVIHRRWSNDNYTEEQLYSLSKEALTDIVVGYKTFGFEMCIYEDGRRQISTDMLCILENLPRYEIPENLFDNVCTLFEEKTEELFDLSAKKLREVTMFHTRCKHDSCNIAKTLHDAGYLLVELTTEENYTLSDFHPFVYGQEIICSEESIRLIDMKISELNKRIASTQSWSFGSEYISAYKMSEHDRRQIDRLQSVRGKITQKMSLASTKPE